MHKSRFVVTATALATALALGACSSNSANSQNTSSMSSSAAASPSSPSADGTQAQAHNDADIAFAQGMIPHHQQAIEMSDMLLAKQGIDPRVVSLANQIKAAQEPEIQQLQGWLADWDAAPTTTSTSSGGGMPDMPGHDMGSMGGGMMSEQDMAALRNAQGIEASRLFLTQMIEHHKGAIAMAQTELNSGQFSPAVELARSIVSSQQKEIDTMQQMLGSL